MSLRNTFFIADDDDDDIFFFREALGEVAGNAQLITASNGIEAMKLLRAENMLPDFIFLDLNMPKKSGRECLIELRELEKFSSVPIIIYSTSSLSFDKYEMLRLGASHFITKFIDFKDLCATLKNLIDSAKGLRSA